MTHHTDGEERVSWFAWVRAWLFPCRQRLVGVGDDKMYRTLLVMKCETCGLTRTVQPNSRTFCFGLENKAAPHGKTRTKTKDR